MNALDPRYHARYRDGYYVVIDTATGNVVPPEPGHYKKHDDGYLWANAAQSVAASLNDSLGDWFEQQGITEGDLEDRQRAFLVGRFLVGSKPLPLRVGTVFRHGSWLEPAGDGGPVGAAAEKAICRVTAIRRGIVYYGFGADARKGAYRATPAYLLGRGAVVQ